MGMPKWRKGIFFQSLWTIQNILYISQNINSKNKLAVMCFMLIWRLSLPQRVSLKLQCYREVFFWDVDLLRSEKLGVKCCPSPKKWQLRSNHKFHFLMHTQITTSPEFHKIRFSLSLMLTHDTHVNLLLLLLLCSLGANNISEILI